MIYLYEDDDMMPVISDMHLSEDEGYALVLHSLSIDEIYEHLCSYYDMELLETKQTTKVIWQTQNTEQ